MTMRINYSSWQQRSTLVVTLHRRLIAMQRPITGQAWSSLLMLSSSQSTKSLQRLSTPQIKFAFGSSILKHHQQHVVYSTSSVAEEKIPETVQIYFASQTGTAQLFAMQLADTLQVPASEPLSELDTSKLVLASISNTWYIFVVSTSGVGEPPENGRAFVEQIQQHPVDLQNLRYSIFALGNSQAHPDHFCAFGKQLDEQLQEHGAKAVLPLCLGDDAESLEEDWDKYMLHVEQLVKDGPSNTSEEVKTEDPVTTPAATSRSTIRSDSYPKFPKLIVSTPSHSVDPIMPVTDLFNTRASSFYADDTKRFHVKSHVVIRRDAPSNATNPSALREIEISIDNDDTTISYETGDHLMVYPQNSDTLVEAYLRVLANDIGPDAVIEGIESSTSSNKSYPHPFGITLYETLRHCVDLQAPPSPSLCRLWNVEYNNHQTVLEILASQSDFQLSAQELLFQLPMLQARYYSIASSNLAKPRSIVLTYRPVNYYTQRGVLRQGVCTGYFQTGLPAMITAAIRSNPYFRLPNDKGIPILFLAGGCGVAPIRAFLEELIWKEQNTQEKLPPVHLFLGFRSHEDAVYADLIDSASHFLVDPQISYGHRLVSDALLENSARVHDILVDQEAHVYVCGGAKTFGAAMRAAVVQLLQDKGLVQDASSFLREMVASGRYHEDLSD